MNKKYSTTLLVITITLLVILVVGATYAYFEAENGVGKTASVNVTASTVDVFTFAVGNEISLNINQENFASGTASKSETTYAKAMLTANNSTNTATRNYYLYLNITNNTFTYSNESSNPEIILTITDENGTELTSVSGLTHVNVTDAQGEAISGFDITTKTGTIALLNNREITTTSTKTEQWNVKLTFVNYNFNQAENAGKSITTNLTIKQESN